MYPYHHQSTRDLLDQINAQASKYQEYLYQQAQSVLHLECKKSVDKAIHDQFLVLKQKGDKRRRLISLARQKNL